MRRALCLIALAVGGCTNRLDVRPLAPQQLPVPRGEPIVLRAVQGGIVNLINQTNHRPLYNGLVTAGDDVTLDSTAHTVKVRGRVVSDHLAPGDVVQISFN